MIEYGRVTAKFILMTQKVHTEIKYRCKVAYRDRDYTKSALSLKIHLKLMPAHKTGTVALST